MKKFLKLCFISLQFITLIAIISIIYGFFNKNTFGYVFRVNFLIGTITIAISLVLLLMPIFLKKDRLTDHTTYTEKYLDVRDKKQSKAYEILYLGLLNITFTALIEFIVWILFR